MQTTLHGIGSADFRTAAGTGNPQVRWIAVKEADSPSNVVIHLNSVKEAVALMNATIAAYNALAGEEK